MERSQDSSSLIECEPSLSPLNDSGITEVLNTIPAEKKAEYAYDIAEIKQAFEDRRYDMATMVDKLIDVIENAYKMSAKDTPYDDYETRLKAIQTR